MTASFLQVTYREAGGDRGDGGTEAGGYRGDSADGGDGGDGGGTSRPSAPLPCDMFSLHSLRTGILANGLNLPKYDVNSCSLRVWGGLWVVTQAQTGERTPPESAVGFGLNFWLLHALALQKVVKSASE